MNDHPLKIQVDADTVRSRATRARRRGPTWLLFGGGMLVLAAIGVGLKWLPNGDPQPAPPSTVSQESVGVEAAPSEGVVPAAQVATVADDGRSLWVSPTAGEPIDLSYLLPGTQVVVHVRVAEMLGHAEGGKVLAALGPWGEAVIGRMTNSTGVELSEIDTLLLGIRPARSGSLEFALCLRAASQFSPEKLRPSCFLPQEDGKVLVWSTPSALPELREQGDAPPLFARELQRVADRTDSQRMATIVFAGKFLQISGEKLVQGAGEPLLNALIDFLGDEATATAFSLHWDDNFFLELQSTVALDERPHRFAALLAERVASASDRMEDALLAEPLHPYGRKVLARFPAMLRKLGNYTRSGDEEGLSVLRCYLPNMAGHNLLMATELVLNAPVVGDRAAVEVVDRGGGAKPRTAGRGLGATTALVFSKETLQKALEMLSEDIGMPIEIAGRDLQLEGITKNQSFAIDLRDRPAEEILLAILLLANPDRTASGPADPKQKLVYVVRQTEGDRASVIVVTTRSAAQRRGEKLPEVFQPVAR